jgi:hypothetical protein
MILMPFIGCKLKTSVFSARGLPLFDEVLEGCLKFGQPLNHSQALKARPQIFDQSEC